MVLACNKLSGILTVTVFFAREMSGGKGRIGEIVTSLVGLFNPINSSKRRLILLTLVCSSESFGVISKSLGGVVSFAPPVGGKICAQEDKRAMIVKNSKQRRVVERLICLQK